MSSFSKKTLADSKFDILNKFYKDSEKLKVAKSKTEEKKLEENKSTK